jgi:hypothetical protein
MLDAEPKAQGPVEVDISRQVLAQHDTPPGQACATCRNLPLLGSKKFLVGILWGPLQGRVSFFGPDAL